MNFESMGGLVGDKNPTHASLMSFVIPGSGQLYNGQKIKGAIMFVTAVTGFALVMDSGQGISGTMAGTQEGGGQGAIGVVLWIGTAAWSGIDARLTALRINREKAQASIKIYPVVQPDRIGTALTLHF